MDVFNVYLILLTLQIAHTLECYDCAATSEYACLSKPKLKRCPTSYQACMTISYTYPNTASKDTPADESVFIKSCVKSEKDCARLCKNILSTGSKKCQVIDAMEEDISYKNPLLCVQEKKICNQKCCV